MKLLLIEDEIQLAQSIMSYLVGENYLCEYAGNFQTALTKINSYEYDCIILDLTLPGGDGMQLLAEIKRQNKQDGLIIISAKDAFEHKVAALHAGADDYLAKPFHLPELSARVFSIIRRRKFNNSNIVKQHEITVDILAQTVLVNEQVVPLTRKEFDLLLYFMSNANKVISKNALAEHLSGDIAGMLEDYNFLYAHIKNFKRKLHDAGCNSYLQTVYAAGYKWEI
ncbi:DNA-binding response OmpR family regulator [Chitinophaga skermanii]|uniref:DNA-binding response OmpR family regulator n=1 Tax=Chitinophaga skermanii TaxID=331697 RepID=A0A327Q1R1_9BACT|nr:response regulator transcription factor [Chitinophaga skermanii]RAI97661.1 DNA-binding response OmpR family regulator [Chitinophaga skermanii]